MGCLPFEKIQREVIVKKASETTALWGCKPEERKTEELIQYGIVNIDKPEGPTSHQVSAYAQRILGIPKSGHSGTLDPGVTGVLPIALGRATRIVQALLPAGKEYVGVMHVHKWISQEALMEGIKKFVGKIQQKPPVKSSVKRIVRTREIYYFDVLEFKDKDVLFQVGCQAGTYIRKLCYDIGQKLGTGAHMAELRRTKAGPFDESTLTTLQDLSDACYFYKEEGNEKFLRHCIKPIEFAVQHLPKVWILDSAVEPLCHGHDLKVPGISKFHANTEEGEAIAVMTLKDELVALGMTLMDSYGFMEKDKGIAVKVNKVFMEPETYKKKNIK